MATRIDLLMRTTVAIVEDDGGIREQLAQLITAAEGMRLTGAFSSAEEALRSLPANPPEIVLMDINLPGVDGIECVRRLRALVPSVQCIMLTMHEDSPRVLAALSAGAVGYLVKGAPAADLLDAIQEARSGGSPMSNHIARKVVQSFQKMGPARQPRQNLTEREEQVLRLLSQGFIYKEIADTLSISVDTVRTHIRKIYEKFEVRTRTEAVARFLS